jgi:hypothetical protein
VIWLYAFTDDPGGPLPPLAGHRDEPLQQTDAERVAAVWSAWDGPRTPPSDVESLWRQEAVLEALMDRRTVLPLRYGTVLEDVVALTELLVNRHGEWCAALERVDGCVEMAVRAGVQRRPAAPADQRESGTGYLARRRREHVATRALAGRIHGRLQAISSASEARPRAVADGTFTGSYLVPRAGVERFSETVQRLAGESPEIAIVCTGPWPPYSFTGAEGQQA